MSLELSQLNEVLINELTTKFYGFPTIEVRKLHLGSANCFRIFDGNKYYFLKEFQSKFKKEDLIYEARIIDFLSTTQIPVARFIRTLYGDWFIENQEHLICIEEYIEGNTYGYDDFPKAFLPNLAHNLARLNLALKHFEMPIDMGKEWLSSYSSELIISQYDSLIAVARNRNSDDNCQRIIEDLEYKKQLAVQCNSFKSYYNDITYTPSHGDFQGCQTVCDEYGVKAIIDFSSARKLPIVWEVMRSFVQSSPDCRRYAKINISELCDYVSEYIKYFPLSQNDLISMPYVYLFQLAWSKYGYSHYLLGTSEDRIGLLNFAFWRTEMCREVHSRLKELSTCLGSLNR